MARERTGQGILLDWISVTYRSVAWTAFLVLALVVGGYFAWSLWFQRGPEQEASQAIATAESQLQRVESMEGDENFEEVCRASRVALIEAYSSFETRDWDTATIAAVRSENLSTRALNMVSDQETGQIVRFHRLEGDVRVKRAGEFSWERADTHMRLQEGDQVRTGSSGSVQLIYFDVTVSTLRPGSLVEIRDLFEDPLTKVRRVAEKLSFGELESITPDMNVKGSFHEVQTTSVSARVEEAGEMRIAHDKDSGTSAISMFQGRAAIRSASANEVLGAGERVTSDGKGRLSAKQKMPGVPKQTAPSDQKVLLMERGVSPRVTLAWDPVKGAAKYRLMISNQSLFANALYDRVRRDTSVDMESVPPGDYFWKVAAIDGAGVQGPFSPARRFRVSSQAVRDRNDKVPPKLQLDEFMPFGSMVVVRGSTEPGATLWADSEKIEVAKDGAFSSVIRLKKAGSNTVRFVAQDAAGNETVVTRSTVVENY